MRTPTLSAWVEGFEPTKKIEKDWLDKANEKAREYILHKKKKRVFQERKKWSAMSNVSEMSRR